MIAFYAAFAALAASSLDTCSSPGTPGVIGNGGDKFPAKTYKDCCALCVAHSECVAFTWEKKKGKGGSTSCYIKDNAVGGVKPCKRDHPGCLSGTKGPGPPGPSPPQPPHNHTGPNGQACLPGTVSASQAYCNLALDQHVRVRALAAALTLPELICRLTSDKPCPAIDRIGLPSFNYRVEAIHGLEAVCIALENGTHICPTYFPTSQGMVATFNRTVASSYGRVVGREARIWTNLNGFGKGNHPMGVNVRCPMVNLLRDPRWGRSGEAPSECPLLTSRFGQDVVEALQSADDKINGTRTMLAIAEVKHGFVYNVETNRKSFDAKVTSFDLMDTYLPPFAATLRDGGAKAYMCSYNAICLDGGECVPSCASRFLSNSTARAHWAFQGFIESDCDSVGDIYENFGFNGSHDSTTASALALEGGTDIDCGKTYGDKHGGLAAAVAQKLTTEDAIRRAFVRAMTPVFAAGQFDALDSTTFTKLGPSAIPGHQAAAKDAARQSMTLLRNDRGALPLSLAGVGKIALVGPLSLSRAELVGPVTIGPCIGSAAFPLRLQGGYKGTYDCIPNLNETLHVALDGSTATLAVAPGMETLTDPTFDAAAVSAAVDGADAVVVAVGTGLSVVDEGADLASIDLPGAQVKLLKSVLKAGKRTIVVLISANAMALDGWLDTGNPASFALLNTFIPSGNWGAEIIVETLLGENRRFGKLPYTHYTGDYVNKIPLTTMSFSDAPGRSYRYVEEEYVTFPFGYGLSYNPMNFSLSAISSRECDTARDTIDVAIAVSNPPGGAAADDEVVMAFMVPDPKVDVGGAPLPKRQLVDFQRISVPDGRSADVHFVISCGDLTLVDQHGRKGLWPGDRYKLVFTDGVNQLIEVAFGVTAAVPVILDEIQPFQV